MKSIFNLIYAIHPRPWRGHGILASLDKFIKNESTNRTISNLVGGNMKIVEDYAQRIAQQKVDENNKKTIINLNKRI